MARGRVITREDAILCGTAWFDAAFMALEPDASVIWHARDGERIKPGQLLCEIDASARALLTAERTGLNFVQLLSGTATMTATYVQAVAGTGPRSSTPARPCPACAWRRNTRCASAAAPTTASASTTAS
jgi:nicotinate-nucleotide pyrophosphorylase (carboxylating)